MLSTNVERRAFECPAKARGLRGHAAAGSAPLTGIVRISAPPALAAYYLVPRLREPLSRMPLIDIELVGEVREASLTRREADIALRLYRPHAPGLAAKSLGAIGYGLYATSRYLKGRHRRNWEFLGYDHSLRHTPQQQWLENSAAGQRFAFRSNDLATLYQAAIAGFGVAVLPHYLARLARELIRIESEPCVVSRKLWLVMHEDVRRSQRVRVVADEIIRLFAAEALNDNRL